MVEPGAARLSSLIVLSGPWSGTELVLEDPVDDVFIGSDPDSRLYLDLPGVSPIHARIWMDFTGASLRDTRSPRGLYLNDTRVDGEAELKDGDVICLGPPGDADSVTIQCRFSPGVDASLPRIAGDEPVVVPVAGLSAADIDVSAFTLEGFEDATSPGLGASDAGSLAASPARDERTLPVPPPTAPEEAAGVDARGTTLVELDAPDLELESAPLEGNGPAEHVQDIREFLASGFVELDPAASAPSASPTPGEAAASESLVGLAEMSAVLEENALDPDALDPGALVSDASDRGPVPTAPPVPVWGAEPELVPDLTPETEPEVLVEPEAELTAETHEETGSAASVLSGKPATGSEPAGPDWEITGEPSFEPDRLVEAGPVAAAVDPLPPPRQPEAASAHDEPPLEQAAASDGSALEPERSQPALEIEVAASAAPLADDTGFAEAFFLSEDAGPTSVGAPVADDTPLALDRTPLALDGTPMPIIPPMPAAPMEREPWGESGHDVFFFDQDAASTPELEPFLGGQPTVGSPPAEPVFEDGLTPSPSEPAAEAIETFAGVPANAPEPTRPETPPPIPPPPGVPHRRPEERRDLPHPRRPMPPRPVPPERTPPAPEGSATLPAPPRPGIAMLVRWAALALAGLLLVATGVFFASRFMSAPVLASVSPTRAGVGDTVTLTGRNFAPTPEGNVVRFGETTVRVRTAAPNRLEVEAPDLNRAGPGEAAVEVTVEVGGSRSSAATLTVFRAPRVQRLSPDVALPGEEVTLIGSGWGPGASVTFGSTSAQILEATPAVLRVRVPVLDAASGTSVPVSVHMGGNASPDTPFFLGRLPLVASVEPASAAAGDVVTIAGRGFPAQPAAAVVQVGSARALVVAGGPSELRAVVPREAAPGPQPLQVRVPGLANVGEGTLAVTPAPDVVEFRFVAEAFVDVPGHDHALLATALGPTLVVSGAGGRSAAERALEAQTRLNEAAAALRARPDLDFEIRDVQGAPKIALVREAGVLVEVTAEDAAAYNEDWTKTGGRGGPVTPARLAVWWEAVMRDLALALVRGEAPRHAAALSVEGRALSEVYRLSARAGAPGLPRLPAVLERAAVRDGMRTVALRVPATVVVRAAPPPPVPGAAPSPVPEASPPAARVAFQLDGLWSGSEVERGVRRYVSLQARGRTGSYTYEGGLSLSVPLLSLEQPQRGVVHFSLRMRGSPRYYEGRWDGARITGRISSAPGGSGDLGTFELAPLR